MSLEIVIYENSKGFKELRRVQKGTEPKNYSQGIFAGPPSLDTLSLTPKQKKELNNFLADNHIIEYKNLLGNKRMLLKFLIDLGLKEAKTIDIRNSVIGLYQNEILINMENE